jgi:hypothetical protein
MSLKSVIGELWQEWKQGALILTHFVIYCGAGCMVAMFFSVLISEALKLGIGDPSHDRSIFVYCSLALGIVLVPFLVGAAMDKWKESVEVAEWKAFEP